MKDSHAIIKKLSSPAFKELYRQSWIIHLWLFGSAARNELQQDSDIDLLYEADLKKTTDKRGVRWISHEIESQLGYRIDLVPLVWLRPEFKESILSQRIQII